MKQTVTLQFSSSKGFTVIETLVIIFVFVMVSIMSFAFLLTTLIGNSKIETMKEARQNGSFALTAIERLIVSSKDVVCNSAQSLTITMLDGTSTDVSCTAERIASGGGYLTSDKVRVLNCNFICNKVAGIPETVGIGYSVSQKEVTAKTSETANVSFSSKVIVRNQKD